MNKLFPKSKLIMCDFPRHCFSSIKTWKQSKLLKVSASFFWNVFSLISLFCSWFLNYKNAILGFSILHVEYSLTIIMLWNICNYIPRAVQRLILLDSLQFLKLELRHHEKCRSWLVLISCLFLEFFCLKISWPYKQSLRDILHRNDTWGHTTERFNEKTTMVYL